LAIFLPARFQAAEYRWLKYQTRQGDNEKCAIGSLKSIARLAQPRFRLPKPAKLPILKTQPTKE
jgi:hypothetical protein